MTDNTHKSISQVGGLRGSLFAVDLWASIQFGRMAGSVSNQHL